jgi:hypothetical protein
MEMHFATTYLIRRSSKWYLMATSWLLSMIVGRRKHQRRRAVPSSRELAVRTKDPGQWDRAKRGRGDLIDALASWWNDLMVLGGDQHAAHCSSLLSPYIQSVLTGYRWNRLFQSLKSLIVHSHQVHNHSYAQRLLACSFSRYFPAVLLPLVSQMRVQNIPDTFQASPSTRRPKQHSIFLKETDHSYYTQFHLAQKIQNKTFNTILNTTFTT